MASARELLNVDDELLDDDVDELTREDLWALWIGLSALERAIEDRVRLPGELAELEEEG